MRANNEPGVYPTVMVHRSHSGQLAIGGAMLNRFDDYEGIVELFQATPMSGGWRTRFDGGNACGLNVQDLPCSVVAMYVEALIHISGTEGAYDEDVVTWPSCYAVAVSRPRGRKEERAYLQSRFSFSHRVQHDGAYDMKNAFDVARQRGLQVSYNTSRQTTREWHRVPKALVPGRIRQILHKTVLAVDEVVDRNFGQGKAFFEPRRPRTRRP